MVVTFDGTLTANPALDASNWWAYYGGFLYTGVSAVASGTQVTAELSKSDPTLEPDSVTFEPPPFDLLDSAGHRVHGFSAFPIT